MTGGLDLVVDIWDWFVDTLRLGFGLPPLPPQLLRLAFERQPKVRAANGLQVQTRRTLYSFLRIEQHQQVLFQGAPPRDGRVVVMPLTGALMQVHLKLESRHPTARNGCVVIETIFEPLPNGPRIERFDVPAKILFGESLACAWHAPAAERVHLAVIEDGDVADRIGAPSGQVVLHPARPGRLMLRLTAETAWGQTTVTRSVHVVVPKLRIELCRPRVQAGHPGEEIQFEWRAYGADSVWLISPNGEDPQLLPNNDGLLFVTLGWRPAEFHLVARGYGGAEKRVVLRAVPQPFASLESN